MAGSLLTAIFLLIFFPQGAMGDGAGGPGPGTIAGYFNLYHSGKGIKLVQEKGAWRAYQTIPVPELAACGNPVVKRIAVDVPNGYVEIFVDDMFSACIFQYTETYTLFDGKSGRSYFAVALKGMSPGQSFVSLGFYRYEAGGLVKFTDIFPRIGLSDFFHESEKEADRELEKGMPPAIEYILPRHGTTVKARITDYINFDDSSKKARFEKLKQGLKYREIVLDWNPVAEKFFIIKKERLK